MRKRSEIDGQFSHVDDLTGHTSFFLVGIGGAGMSALARMLRRRGFHVQGTDSTESSETERLVREGIEVAIQHSGKDIGESMALVVTDAIDLDSSPEVERARELRIPIVRRSQALGWLLREYRVIAITGTHGKTTTTGMLGAGLMSAGADPLVVVGANIPQWNGPVREGKGKWAVVEACEAYDALVDIQPTIVLLTNLELDHVDFHGNYENLRDSVLRFVNRIPPDGFLVYCGEDRGACEIAELTDVRAISYGLSIDWARQIANKLGIDPEELPGATALANTRLTLPGRHNALNACGALIAGGMTGADTYAMMKGISEFGGAERRLQVVYEGSLRVGVDRSRRPDDWIAIVDDYAHHPSEITASLSALRDKYFGEDKPGKRLVVAFQPHLYSRTASLINEFAQALSAADFVVLTDIYPAREAPLPGVSSARVAERVTAPVRYVPSRRLLPIEVARWVRPGDVVVGMGAGNVSEFAPALVEELERRVESTDLLAPKNVVVIYGGESSEREVSILSGRAIHAALKRLGHRSRMIDLTDRLLVSGDVSDLIGPSRPDLAFLAVHGTRAEDGAIQGLLELLHIPYTGSGIQASAIAMDKEFTKRILADAGIRVPRGRLVRRVDESIDFPGPYVVKPNAQGSTVGLSFVKDAEDLASAIRHALAYDDCALVEEWIEGMEISVPVLGDEALVPVEIAPASGVYDFASKYTPGATEEIVPARLPSEILEDARHLALRAHRILGCVGATRTDAMVRGNEIVVLEVNTLPGMTGTSLLPNSAAAMGITFDELCRRMLVEALTRDAAKA